jgi:uncharacterized protein YdaU (DUF1376 family)
MHYYQHHIGDFIKSTSFLTNEEVGIYMKLIWYYYDTEGPIENNIDQLSMRVSARDQKEKVSWIVSTFFLLNEDGTHWINNRCEEGIAEYYDFINSKKRAGKASAEKRALKNSSTTDDQESNTCSTDVQPTTNHYPLTTNHKQKKGATEVAVCLPDWMPLETWDAFLKMRKRIKKPATDYAIKLLINKLDKFRLAGQDVQAILERSITSGWQDLYEIAEVKKPVNKYDSILTTVPGSTVKDPALAKLDEDAKIVAPPSLETLARLAALRQEMKNG